MKSKNVTRNALFTSIISLLLCVSMLVGTTFAWFTDEVKSGNNVIAAGNLDIDVMYANTPDGTYESIENVADLFVAPAGATKGLWEPGHTEVAYLKVVNNGTLALKYQFMVDAASEVIGESVLGNDIKLSEILKFAATEPSENAPAEYDRETAQAAAEASTGNLLGYTTGTKTLAPGVVHYIALVVYMPETTGNEANYRGDAVPTINFKLTALATQVEAESDSFGDDYDEDAWDNALLVTTADDLKDAIAAGNEEIMLANDIALTEALEIPAGTTLALNLNGKSLTGTGLDADGKGTAVIVNEGNLKLVNGNVKATGENGGATINNKGTLTLDDVAVIGAPISSTDSGYPGYCINSSGNLTIENGTTVSADRGCLYLSGTGSTVINGGSFTNNDISDKRDQFTSHVVVVANGANNKLTINGGTFKHLHTKTSGGVVINNRSAVTVDVNGGNFSGGNYYGKWDNLSDYGYGSTKTPFAVRGGTFTGMDEKFIAAGYKAVESNGKYIVVSENVDGVVTTAAGLADAIAQGGVVSVMADIDMNNAWTSVVPANGLVIEGNDHVISNLNLPLMAGKGGPTVTVKGLTIADSNVGIAANENSLGTGAFIAFADYSGTLVFEDCHLVNSTVTGNERAAAFVGYSYADVTIKDCSVDKCTITAVGSSAALIGHANGVTTIEKTSVTNTKVTATEDRTGSTAVAGSLIGTVANTTALNKVTSSNNTVSNTGATPYSAEFGRILSPGKLIVDGAELKTASSQAALDAAVSSTGNVEITLTNGEYKMPSSGTTGEVTITGTKDTVLDMTMGAYMESANVTIEGVTIKTSTGMVNGNGADYAALYTPNVTYKDCTFVGPLRVGRDGAKFINCTFTKLGNDYVWTYGNDVTFENCTFNTDGKAVLIYSDGGNEVSQVSVKNCVFNSTQGAKAGAIANQNCAAIEIHNYGNGVNLTTEGNTYNSNFSGEWRIKTYESGKTHIFVNGTEYTTIALDGKTMTIDANKNVTVQ